jgi:hypothetical protein
MGCIACLRSFPPLPLPPIILAAGSWPDGAFVPLYCLRAQEANAAAQQKEILEALHSIRAGRRPPVSDHGGRCHRDMTLT